MLMALEMLPGHRGRCVTIVSKLTVRKKASTVLLPGNTAPTLAAGHVQDIISNPCVFFAARPKWDHCKQITAQRVHGNTGEATGRRS